MNYNHWTCPFCNRDTTIIDRNIQTTESQLRITNQDGYKYLRIDWIVCPNVNCQKYSLYFSLYGLSKNYQLEALIKEWRQVPQSSAKIFPEYIPIAIRKDYEEACLILELSPKASATLSRRCLQGIIRDFWGIKKNRLIDEINELQNKIDPLTWKTIDATRKIGNIGAHMEKDIDLIIDVEIDEAKAVLNLVEILIKEWYIHRHEKEQQFNSIIAASQKKEGEKNKL